MLYQDTDAGPFDTGSSRLADHVQQRPRRDAPPPRTCASSCSTSAEEELEAARADLELVDGTVRVKGSPTKSGDDRRRWPRRLTATSCCSAGAPDARAGDARVRRLRLRRPARHRVVPRPAVDHPRGALQGRPRHRRRPRAATSRPSHDCGRILNRIGADGQVYGGVVMGIGRRSPRARSSTTTAGSATRTCSTTSSSPCPTRRRSTSTWIETDTPNAGPKGSKGVGEPPCVPTAGAVANAIAQGDRQARRPAADDARARLGGDAGVTALYVRTATTLDEALAALAGGAASGRRRHRPRRRRAPGQGAAARTRSSRSTASPSSAASTRSGGGLRLGALVTHARDRGRTRSIRERYTALADASAIVGSHATRAQGTIGGNVMNASPAMETGGPLICLGAVALRSVAAASATSRVEELFDRSRQDERPARTSCWSRSTCRRPPPGTGSCYVRLEYRRQMEIAVVGATAGRRSTADSMHRRAGRDHRARADDPPRARRPRRRSRQRRRPGRSRARGRLRGRRSSHADLRRARLRRYRRAMAEVIARRAIDAAVARARGSDVPIPASPALHGAGQSRTKVRGRRLCGQRRRLPGRARARHAACCRSLRDEIGLDRLQGGLRRLRVRRLHDAARRRAGELVLVPRAAGRGQRGHDGRGSRRRTTSCSPLQRAFLEQGGVQCGFCTPGMLISATALLRANPRPTEEEIRIGALRATSAAAPATTASSRRCSRSRAARGRA